MYTVGRSDDDPGVDEGAAALVDVELLVVAADRLLLEDRHHPGELAELRLVVLGPGDAEAHALGVASPAALAHRWPGRDLLVGWPHIRWRAAYVQVVVARALQPVQRFERVNLMTRRVIAGLNFRGLRCQVFLLLLQARRIV